MITSAKYKVIVRNPKLSIIDFCMNLSREFHNIGISVIIEHENSWNNNPIFYYKLILSDLQEKNELYLTSKVLRTINKIEDDFECLKENVVGNNESDNEDV